MTTTTNAEYLRQYKSRFSLIVEQIMALPSRGLTWLKKVKNLSSNFERIT